MSNEGDSNLNMILGQLEDELRAIKSSRKQADDIVSANSELSSTLERVIVETRELVEKSNTQTLGAVEALSSEISRMSEQTDAIKKAADKAVDSASSQISEYTERAISGLNQGLDEARGEIVATSESVKLAASDVKASSNALLETNESAATENKRQNEETRALLNETQARLADIDASIATLKEIDVGLLAGEIRELKTVEANNMTALKSKLMTVTILAGTSVVICLATLAKLLVG